MVLWLNCMLPKKLNKHNILKNIDFKKDIDGYNPLNKGKLLLNYDKYLISMYSRGLFRDIKIL